MPKRSELKLTKRAVDALSVESKDAMFWDRDLAGFGVRVHATGRRVYVVQSRRPGGPKRVTLGRHGELSADEARKRAAGVIDRIKRGEDPNPKPPEVELTVSGLVERFMRVHASTHCKPETAATYHSVINGRILPALNAMALDEVGRTEVTALHHRLRETPAMANAAVGILSKMFSLAEAWGLVPAGRNPCRVVRRYRARSCERFLTPAEFRRLGRALRDMEAEGAVWPPAIAAIRLLTLTGCRKSEILSLRWDDADLPGAEPRRRGGLRPGRHARPPDAVYVRGAHGERRDLARGRALEARSRLRLGVRSQLERIRRRGKTRERTPPARFAKVVGGPHPA